ncbi:alpha/beta hydrolase [Saccharospirillum salsuginis]|uniref:Phospholipase/carboxylesterase n=1 Tax=Saccharospirillum salsuginis TaxID=418750 RepID=A0A918N5N6_9GAMM|nr:dienelactone hydrolase family protein [Saccharospirillum salsuginis]GGX42807.1 phospholipase/carboxylesterase [Saccharospirillum salsuginis]
MADLLPHIELSTRPDPDATVIWLHGLGADGHDFEPIVPELHLPDDLGIRFIFPHAPQIPVTINAGYVMPAWYDIYEMTINRKVDTQGLRTSAAAIDAFIDRELERGIDSRRIILAGFSQGGAVAYECALRHPKPLGGLMALSTYFATADDIQRSETNARLPTFVGHGTFDPIVPEALGRNAAQELNRLGYPVEYKTYSMEHSVHPEEIRDISGWLQKLLKG